MGACVFGIDYFHHYLVGRRFALLTDHKPVVPLSLTHTKTLNRLQLKMQDMHPDVGYIPGKDNVVSDFLSRYNSMGASPQALSDKAGVGVEAVDISFDRFHHLQMRDALCIEAVRFLAQHNKPTG